MTRTRRTFLSLLLSLAACTSYSLAQSQNGQATRPLLADGLSLGIAYGILSLADGNIKYLLGKLGGIAWTFGHEPSMPQAHRVFETETLPEYSTIPQPNS